MIKQRITMWYSVVEGRAPSSGIRHDFVRTEGSLINNPLKHRQNMVEQEFICWLGQNWRMREILIIFPPLSITIYRYRKEKETEPQRVHVLDSTVRQELRDKSLLPHQGSCGCPSFHALRGISWRYSNPWVPHYSDTKLVRKLKAEVSESFKFTVLAVTRQLSFVEY